MASSPSDNKLEQLRQKLSAFDRPGRPKVPPTPKKILSPYQLRDDVEAMPWPVEVATNLASGVTSGLIKGFGQPVAFGIDEMASVKQGTVFAKILAEHFGVEGAWEADTQLAPKLKELANILSQAHDNSTAAQFSEFITEWGSYFVGATKFTGFFSRQTVKVAPKLIEANAARAGELAKKMGLPATEGAAKAVLKSASKTINESLRRQDPHLALEVAQAMGATTLERGLMLAGNAVGFGVYEYAWSRGHGDDFEGAMRKAALATALGGTAEGALLAAGKLIGATVPRGLEKLRKFNPELKESHKLAAIQRGEDAMRKLVKETGSRLKQRFTKNTTTTSAGKGVMEEVPMTLAQRERRLIKAWQDYNKDPIKWEQAAQVAWMTQKGLMPVVPFGVKSIQKAGIGVAKKRVQKIERKIGQSVTDLRSLRRVTATPPPALRSSVSRPINYQDKLANRVARRGEREKVVEAFESIPKYLGAQAKMAGQSALEHTGIYSEVLARFRRSWMESAEGTARRLGLSGMRMLAIAEEVEMKVRVDRYVQHSKLREGFKLGAKAMDSFREAGGKKAYTRLEKFRHQWAKDVRDVYELENMAGVRSQFSPEVAAVWRDTVHKPLQEFGKMLSKRGIISTMDQVELAKHYLPRGAYFPHLVKHGTDLDKVRAIMLQNMVRDMSSPTKALFFKQPGTSAPAPSFNVTMADKAMAAGDYIRKGHAKVNHLDFQRLAPGSTKWKIKNTKIPLDDDPLRVMMTALDGNVIRKHMADAWGPDLRMADFFRRAIISEGGDAGLAQHLSDVLTMKNVADQGWARFANRWTSAEMVAKLTMASIPNLFQGINTAAKYGPKAAIRSQLLGVRDALAQRKMFSKYRDALKSEDIDSISEALGLMENSFMSRHTAFSAGEASTPMEWLSSQAMNVSLFTPTEKMNRVVAAHSALYYVRTTAAKAIRGELRGLSAGRHQRQFAELGLDLKQIVRRYKQTAKASLEPEELSAIAEGTILKGVLGPDKLRNVITQGVRKTQFTTGVTDVPWLWRTPWGRVVTQFKSFAFNQGKFLRDTVMREFMAGNYEPLLYFMGMSGVSGEAILAMKREFLGQRQPKFPEAFDVEAGDWASVELTDFFRFFEDITNAGGLGLAQSAATSLYYGRPLETALGPTFSDVANIGAALVQTGTGKTQALERVLKRQTTTKVIYRLMTGGKFAVGQAWDFTEDVLKEFNLKEDKGDYSSLSSAHALQDLVKSMKGDGE